MAVIKLRIYVANLTNVMGLFDKIQVERSTAGESGPFTEITAASAAAATFLGTETASFTLNGKTLELEVDGGSEQTITFVTADPINADDTVDFINDNLTGATATEDTGAVRLTSDTTGTSSLLEITGGTSLTELGFTLDALDNGEDARITLQAGVETYEYDDQSGDPDNYYRTRFYNSGTGAVSSYSDPVKGDIGSIISASQLILATVDLANLDGTPIDDRRVSFHSVYVPGGFIVDDIGVVGRTVDIFTDQAGHAETMLVKGALVNVSISGTSIMRQITIPTSGSEFNVLDEIAAADDIFQIQIPDIPAAVRRS
jgi:hypothetical protein